MSLIDLKFNFSDPNNITFYGDEVSGFRNESGNVKAFIQDETKFLQWNKTAKQLIVPTGECAEFIFKPKIYLEGDFKINLDFEIGVSFVSTFLFGTTEKIHFKLYRTGIEIVLEEETISLNFNSPLKNGRSIIYIYRQNGVIWIEKHLDASRNISQVVCDTPFLFEYFLGGTSVGEAKYNSFEITDKVKEMELMDGIEDIEEFVVNPVVVDEFSETEKEIKETIDKVVFVVEEVEEVEAVEEVVEEEAVEEVVEEEAVEEVVEVELEETEISNIKMKELTEVEKLMVTGYAELLVAAKGTKVAKYYKTASELEQESKKNKVFLVKIFYYILSEQKEWSSASHAKIKTRAYELSEIFGKHKESNAGRKYGFKAGATYKSFAYGVLTDEDLTDDLIVELLMEEYEGIRELIIKL